MCHIIDSSYLMFQRMRCEVSSDDSAAAGQTIMRQTSCPHHFCPGIVVLRITDQNSCIFNYGTHQTFCNAVCNLHIPAICKITFHRMHQDIRTSACSLIIWQCHGKFRIHDRKTRSSIITAVSSLDPSFFFCNNRRITHLASGCCDCKYNPYRKTACCLTLSVIEIPYIPFIGYSISDCFCRINRTSSAYCKNEIYTFFLCKLDSFIHQRKSWIRYCSSKFYIIYLCIIQRSLHFI